MVAGENHPHYHVIGVRGDGSHAVVGTRLSLPEARRVRAALAEANVFRAVKIKADPRSDLDIKTLAGGR